MRFSITHGICLLSFIALLPGISAGQSIELPPVPKTRTCATMEMDSALHAKYPRLETLDEFEQVLQKKIAEIKQREKAGRLEALVITIPVIFHIVHNGEAVGNGTNISVEQVQAQIDVLNEDFRRKIGTPGENNDPVGADIEVEFCLSNYDESGNELSELGIHRFNGGRDAWTRVDIEGNLKPNTIWNPNLFYNIWTLKFDTEDELLLGYAQFPSESGLSGINPSGGSAATDGVVIRYTVCGSAAKGDFPIMQAPYNRGRTLTHETGHWLGLRHIWGDGPCGTDDFCGDTPEASGPHRGCPVGTVTCSSTDMPQNYMDYTDDACMNIFTQDQKTRMRAVMEVSTRRASLLSGNLCGTLIADAPKANFGSENDFILLGGEALFIDLSSNFPTEWHWKFEGGTPSESTLKNPKVIYNVEGIYDVELIAKNAYGVDTISIIDYIEVSPEGICSEQSNLPALYTPTLVIMDSLGLGTGYLGGHNSKLDKAKSEFFSNPLGYEYVSGIKLKFGYAYAQEENATINVVMWNARGPQNSPGAVIERSVVLVKEISEDIANNRATEIVFSRETTAFGKPFHIGIELDNAKNIEVALVSTAIGEANNATSWEQDKDGLWNPISINLGLNVAFDIMPIVGLKPSVQMYASDLIVFPGQEVILQGRGASIFEWNSDDGNITNVLGPQIKVNPARTTTYTLTGSGLELCEETVSRKVYVLESVTAVDEVGLENSISLYPNPGTNVLNLQLTDSYEGCIDIVMYDIVGNALYNKSVEKYRSAMLNINWDTSELNKGLYIIKIQLENRVIEKRWVKH